MRKDRFHQAATAFFIISFPALVGSSCMNKGAPEADPANTGTL
jgi:hypothetical protein